ncbi:VCBS domain-containing protein [Psychrobacter sp. NPDC064578]|uniref:VCBS domain-containing protein n=1 Tax=Psychrobacter sp. NPDC064578 TaxID=3364493 RepID=UPI00384D9312
MNTITVKTNDATKTIDQVQVVIKNGKPTIITAMDKVNYEFHDTAIGRAPNHIITKRLKNDLHVSFEEDGKESDLIIEGFYDNADSALLGISEDGEYYYYIPDTGETYDYVTQLEEGAVEGQALGGQEYAAAIPWWMPAAAGLGLIGIVAGSSSNSSSTTPPVNEAPVAENDTVKGETGQPVIIDVVANDSDPENDLDPTTVKLIDPVTGNEVTNVVVDGEGTWSVDGSTGKVTFTPEAGFTADPTPVDYVVSDKTGEKSNQATITVDYPGIVSISGTKSLNETAADGSANEATYTVSISNPSTEDTVVTITISDGSTEGSADYTAPVTQDVTIPAGQTSVDIKVPIVDDNLFEGPENFTVTVTDITSGNATIGPENSVNTTIYDDGTTDGKTPVDPNDPSVGDDKPLVGIIATKPQAVEGETGNDTLEFTISQDNVSNFDTVVTVNLGTGTTVDADDIDQISYTVEGGPDVVITDTQEIADFLATGTVTIPAGSSFTPVITVTAKDDDIFENSEDLVFDISTDDDFATVSPTQGTATGTILDEDNGNPNDGSTTDGDKPVVSIIATEPSAVEGETGNDTLEFTISQDNVSNFDTVVTVNLGTGTTVDADDIDQISYTVEGGPDVVITDTQEIADFLATGTVTIPAGSSFTPVITVTAKDDDIFENSEDLVFDISTDDDFATVSPTQGTATGTIIDNDVPPTIDIVDEDVALTPADNSVIEGTGNTITGTINITNPQSVTDLTVGGLDVTNASNTSVTINTSLGKLVITNYNAATGELTYEYTENGNAEDHSAGSVVDQFNVILTNSIGDTITDTLDIEIIDTAPNANNDKNSVTEDVSVDQPSGKITATGNVIKGTAPDQADDLGADATMVTAVEFGSTASTVNGTAPTLIQGDFGELTLNANGTYIYDVINNNPEVQALGVNDKLTETFTYTITDADGDSSSATLTITITGTNDRPVITNAVTGTDVIASESFSEPAPDTVVNKTGTVTFKDIDLNDQVKLEHVSASTTVTVNGTSGYTLSEPQETALKALFYVDGTPSDVNGIGNSADWTFNAPENALDFIPAGETITIRYAVQVSDNAGIDSAGNGNELSNSEIRYVEVTITGTDNKFVLVDDEVFTPEDTDISDNIFENGTPDADDDEELTVDSYTFELADGTTITKNAGESSDILVDGTNSIGNITVNSDGSYTFVPADNYSGQVPDITINVSNGPDATTQQTGSETLTITVNPVSDVPGLKDVSVETKEDTSVLLGLKVPTITDSTDLDTSSDNDTPERLGYITLSDIPAGAVLKDGSGNILTPNADGNIVIQLTDTGSLVADGTPTASMTSEDFQGITLTPPANDATNISFDMSVTEYEMDSNGNVAQVGGVDVAGATSTVKIEVDVQAVTDSVDKNDPNDPDNPHDAGDDASKFGYDQSEVVGDTLTVTLKEGESIELPITTTFGDLVGNAAKGDAETYGFVITGLVPGAIINFTPAGSSEPLPPFIADENGQVLIGINAGLTSTDFVVSGNSEPKITIQTGKFDSLDMNGVEISLYTQDHDPDSAIKNTSVDLIGTVKVDLTVTPVAGQVELVNKGVETKEDTVVTLDKFGFTVQDKQDDNGLLPETITTIQFVLPEGWTYKDSAGTTTVGSSGGTPIIISGITPADNADLDAYLEDFSITPPAHSSRDADFTFTVTTVDPDDDGGIDLPATGSQDLTQTVVVTPVAEVVGGRSDSDAIDDLTINPSHTYAANANEDAAFDLNSDGFDLKGYWNNQDTSEQTFAHMTFGNKSDSGFTSVEGAVFTYNDGNGLVSLTDNGNGVDIPMEYLDTVTVTPPQDYSDYNLTSGAETAVKVEAKTVDVDEDGGAKDEAISGESYLTFEVKGVADPATLAVDPAEGVEDQAINGGNNRDTAADMTTDVIPTDGIVLNIRPSSRDNDGSETYDVTISEIPADGQLYYTNKDGDTLLLDTTGGTVVIEDYNNSVTGLYFVPAENFSGTVNLKVQAVSQEGGTTGAASPMLNLPVKVIGKADLIINDKLATGTALINGKDYTYVTDEATLDSTGNHQIALSSLFATVADIEAYDGDSPAVEQIVYRVENLPTGFNLTGAGVTFLGGSGSDRVWSVTLEALQNNTAQLKTPDNFAGEINFTITGTTTETVSGDSVTHDGKDVSILVTPDAADGNMNDPQVVATEDLWATMDFESAFTTTDKGDSATGTESLESITLSVTDLMAKDFILRVDGIEVDLTTNPPPTLKFTPDQTIEIMYDDDKRHSDDDVSIEFDYTYTDTTELTDGSEISTSNTGSAVVDVTFQAVTDAPSMTLDVTDDTINNSGTDNTASVTVSLSSPDQDGSESFTRLEVTDVPEGLNVVGGILSDGIWYVDVPNDPVIITMAPTYELVLERNDSTVNIPKGSFNIKVTGITQDINGQGSDGSEARVEGNFEITLDRTGGGDAPVKPDLIDSFTSKVEIPAQLEDTGFTLGDILDATLNPATADTVDSYTFSLTDLPTGTVLESTNPAVSVQQIGGKWIISVNDASNLNPEAALNGVTVTPPKDFSTNVTDGTQDFTFNANFTVLDKDGGEEREQVSDVNVEIKPVTDPMDADGKSTTVATDEDTSIDININLKNSADGDYVLLINGKLYIQVDESSLLTGTGPAGVLTDANGNPLNEVVLNDNEVGDIPAGTYYELEVGTNSPDSVTVKYTPAENADGNATITVKAAHKETTDEAGYDSGTLTYEHEYTVEVSAQPDNLDITSNSGESIATAIGDEDSMIAIDYKISNIDEGDMASAITLDNIPNGYLVYYTDTNGDTVLASNNGNSGGNNSWSIDTSKLNNINSGAAGETPNIFIMPPENSSDKVTGIEMKVVNDSGMISDPLVIDLDVTPVADGVTANPSTILGNQGKWTTLNLNAVMQDTDGSETVNIAITDNGVSLTDDVLRFRVKSTGEMLTAVWDDAANSYTITGITPEQINDLQIQSSVPLKGDLDFALSTTDTVGAMTDTSGVYTDNNGELPSISVDIAFSKTFVGTAENDIVDASGQSVAVNYKGGAGDDILIGGSGNDLIDGGTGVNTLKGGAGNDKIVFSVDNALMDGGAGNDTLLINVADTSIDFSSFDATVFESIETIDMTGNGAQTLTNLSTSDVLDIINDTVMSNKGLVINGDSADSVSLTGNDWTNSGTTTQGGNSYNVYSFSDTNGTHELLIQTDITIL